MSKFYDIKGQFDMSGNYQFNETSMWEGRIRVEEDGWFEGIVIDPNSLYQGDRFIFGIYHPDKAIELLKVSPKDVSDPFVFRGKKRKEGYDGKFFVIESFGELSLGNSRITTKSTTLEVDDELVKRIDRFKEKSSFKDLYENTFAIRKQYSEIVFRNVIGVDFSDKEIEKIMTEVQPVTDKVLGETMDEVKQLIKEASTKSFPLN